MNRFSYAARVLFLGLFTAQVLATIQVYLTNVELYRTLMAISDAGYLTVPNQRTTPGLLEFGPAFFGGLFFAFSVGAGLSIFSLAAAWVWDRLLYRNKYVLIPFLLLWAGCLVEVNRRGFCPMVSCYFLIIPPLVFAATLKWMPPLSGQRIWFYRMAHAVPFGLLALLWTSHLDGRMFLDVRDHLFLSNPLGTKINDFYYTYTLYPAEVFKSLNQKLLRTCNLENVQKESPYLERQLLEHDYLAVAGDGSVDLKTVQEGTGLVFEHKGRAVLRTTLKDFFSTPGTVLKEFSAKCDRQAFFRRFTFLSLVLGFPVALYIILYGLFRLLSSFFLDISTSSVIASVLCCIFGIALLVPLHYSRGKTIAMKDLPQALESKCWQERVAALKIIEQKGMEIGDFQAYKGMLASPYIPERYWLVRALGASRQSETYEDLLAFLNDPHPNVVRMAFYALGQRGDRRVVKEIIRRIETSDDWYNQWYAYKALRALGWKQTKSR